MRLTICNDTRTWSKTCHRHYLDDEHSDVQDRADESLLQFHSLWERVCKQVRSWGRSFGRSPVRQACSRRHILRQNNLLAYLPGGGGGLKGGHGKCNWLRGANDAVVDLFGPS